jgi:hypothetical protein
MEKNRLIKLIPSIGLLFILLWTNGFCDTVLNEMIGKYDLIYDSTYIWPGENNDYDYFRKFISEATLDENGRSVLSRTATPVIENDDQISYEAYTISQSGEIFRVVPDDITEMELPSGRKRIFVNFRQADPGAKLHFEWEIKSFKTSLSGKRFIGRTVPVDSAKVVLTVPENWIFNFTVSPDIPVLRNTERIDEVKGTRGMNYSWAANDIEGLTDEEFAPPYDRIIPCLYFTIYEDLSWDDQDRRVVDWKFISSLYNEKLKKYVRSTSSISAIMDSIAAGNQDQRAMATSAFEWVKRNFRSETSDISLSESFNIYVERGRGSQADEAVLFYAALGRLGIPRGIYLASTRNVGDPLPDFPALSWFDRLLVTCYIGNDTLWADPFHRMSDLGVLPFEDQGVSILRIDTPGELLESTPEIDYHENGKAIHLTLYIDSTGALQGEATEIYSGAFIPEISSYITSINENQRKTPWETRLAKSFPGAIVDQFKVIPPDSTGDEYRIGYSFTTNPLLRPFASRVFISMDILGRWEDLPDLPQLERRFPILLKRPRFEFERISFILSPKFKVESLPKNYSLNSHIGEIYSVAREGDNSITITRGFGLKTPVLPATTYNSLIRFINAAKAEAGKQIILKRTD